MVKQMVRPLLCGVMARDQSAHDRAHQVIEKELRKGNKTTWSVGHMEDLQYGARPMVQWV